MLADIKTKLKIMIGPIKIVREKSKLAAKDILYSKSTQGKLVKYN